MDENLTAFEALETEPRELKGLLVKESAKAGPLIQFSGFNLDEPFKLFSV